LGGKGVITLKKKELRRIHEFAEKAVKEGRPFGGRVETV
jgi:hypothetical protein